MKKLLATTAVVTMAMASTVSAQSVLERVLGQIDNATNVASVNGTFANIAENIGGGASSNYMDANGDIISASQYETALDAAADQISVTTTTTSSVTTTTTYTGTSPNITANVTTNTNTNTGVTVYTYGSSTYSDLGTAIAAAESDISADYTAFQVTDGGIDGSITNIIDGITAATQTAVAGVGVSAIEYNMPSLDFGNMATTALGAVNTGDITLGVNSTVDNAKTSSTEAVSVAMAQIGGSADTGALVLNIASNMTEVNGSINNTMEEVNGTVGDLSTTALGAVNTGTILSGVNAAVTGITGATAGQ